MLAIILGLVTIVLVAYKLYTDVFNYWKRRGFPYAEGRFPLGSDPCLSNPSRYMGQEVQVFYKKFAGLPCGGIYVGRRPELVVCDPQLIKNILVKDFNHFQDRSGESSCKNRPLTQHLFALDGWKWRALRFKLTPTFASGKLKLMFGVLIDCAQKLEFKLGKIAKSNGDGSVDIKDIAASFTTDVIGSCAFGLDLDSLNNPEQPFRKVGILFSKPSMKEKMIELLYSIFPDLRKIWRFTRTSSEIESIFLDGIAQTVKLRETSKIRRDDFIDLLLDLKNQGSDGSERETATKQNGFIQGSNGHENLEMDMGLLAAQCYLFFIAGFETSSSVQSFAIYEMALNQSVQGKLRSEIDDAIEQYGGLNYQSLHNMPYLDQVVNETIRKYPTLHTLTRVCTKPYTIPGTNLVIEEGIRVIIPTYSLQHDPQYFPDPETFNPDRFSDANKSSISPFTFLPFGEGPRNCIGMRFGLLLTKIGIATLVRNHRVSISPKTDNPLVLRNSTSFFTLVEGKIILKLEDI